MQLEPVRSVGSSCKALKEDKRLEKMKEEKKLPYYNITELLCYPTLLLPKPHLYTQTSEKKIVISKDLVREQYLSVVKKFTNTWKCQRLIVL